MVEHSMKKILIGITGGIAAYKMPECIRQLSANGFDVRVVLSRAAHEFVTQMTLEAVSHHPVYTSLWDAQSMLHIELARWADLILIAPATAHTIAKLSGGLADDLLSNICLAATVPLYIAPAMNCEMWANQATQANIQTLLARQVTVLGPARGEQACGEVGMGRMLEPEEIVAFICAKYQDQHLLAGRRILITAGPTREAIDSIRYFSNRSSGKMGYALAQAARQMGAEVTLVSGPCDVLPPPVTFMAVESAQQMYEAVMQALPGQDVFIAAAAVADYTPKAPAMHKIKKQDAALIIEYERTQDILKTVAALEPRPVCIGFAAEDVDLLQAAQHKLESKKLDMIVANYIEQSFGRDDNSVVILDRTGGMLELKQQSKLSIAQHILQQLSRLLGNISDIPTVLS